MIKGLTIENFAALGVDDKVELPPLIPAFPFATTGRVKARTADTVTFVMTLAGVTLGLWTCTLDQGKFRWRTT